MPSSRRPRSRAASSSWAWRRATWSRSRSTGRGALEVPCQRRVGESSPAVAGGQVYVGDLCGVFHAVRRRRRQAGLDVQDRQRDQIVARGGRRPGAHRVVRRAPYALNVSDGPLAWKVEDRRLRARDARGRGRRGLLRRVRRGLPRDPRSATAGSCREPASGVHRRVGGHAIGRTASSGRSTTKCSHSTWRPARCLALLRPGAPVPVLLVRRGRAGHGRRGRARQAGARASTPRRASAGGRSRRAPGSNRRRPSPASACTSARAMAGSTCSISRPAPGCGSTSMAGPVSASRPSRAVASSSAHRTAGSSASGEAQTLRP